MRIIGARQFELREELVHANNRSSSLLADGKSSSE